MEIVSRVIDDATFEEEIYSLADDIAEFHINLGCV